MGNEVLEQIIKIKDAVPKKQRKENREIQLYRDAFPKKEKMLSQ